jgi:hypothetical protein
VRYPLIANTRLWTYNDGTAEDITTNGGAIQYDELFPAVKVSKLFEAIENTYGLTFTGTFLNDPRFTQCFLFGKNTNEWQFITEAVDIDFNSTITTSGPDTTIIASDYVDLTANTITIQYNPNQVLNHSVLINAVNISNTATFYIEVYQDNNLFQVLEGNNTGTLTQVIIPNAVGLDSVFTFKAKANTSVDIDFVMTYNLQRLVSGNISNYYTTFDCNTTILTGNVNLNASLPDFKVSEFFTGVLKQFNATCVSVGTDTFEVLPLDEWYAQGVITDITEYTDVENIDVERVKLYKKISFKYQKSESFENRRFFTTTEREYGDLDYQFDYDGSDYVIQQPFENLKFLEYTGSGVYAGFCLDQNFQPYTPKPVLLYFYGQGTSAQAIKFFDDTTTQDITNYAIFGQDIIYQNQNYSLNWGAEISLIQQQTVQNGLYQTYYFPYLINLYNLKNRLYQVKTNLPVSLLTTLRLNDRLVIRDKRYIINEMKSNLTTGEVNFSLLLDFRPVNPDQVIIPDKEAQCLDVPINFINGAVQADITTSFAGVTITPSTIFESQTIQVCIPENTESGTFIITEDAEDYINTEEYERFITDESSAQVITLIVTFTFADGSTAQTQIIIQQP